MEILIPLYPVVPVFLLNRPWLTFRAMLFMNAGIWAFRWRFLLSVKTACNALP